METTEVSLKPCQRDVQTAGPLCQDGLEPVVGPAWVSWWAWEKLGQQRADELALGLVGLC